jgi:ATP-dependent RNA helicase DDX47/RRP3
MGYKTPTKIQTETLPYTLKGKDIIGLAETGSGKTAAYGLPIIHALLKEPTPYFALILSPTRELALQISEHMKALGQSIGLNCCTLVGGLDAASQIKALASSPHIIVGTPGRILDHMKSTKGVEGNLKKVKFLVFDEADKLLNMDFEKHICEILSCLSKERTTMLFSATMTGKVEKLQRASLRDPVKIQVNEKYQTVATLTQNYLFIPARYKECYLAHILNQFNGKITIVFISTILSSIKVYYMLRIMGYKVSTINGKLSQNKRINAITKFKAKETNILIATDVANRGLDIQGVDLVINYDIPAHSKDYIHRVGRTARAGKSGLSISIVTQYDVESFQKIESLIGKKLEEYNIEEDVIKLMSTTVNEAEKLANDKMKDLTTKSKIILKEDDDNEVFEFGKRANSKPADRSFAKRKKLKK